MSTPSEPGPERSQGLVALGVVLGLIGSFFLPFLMTAVLYEQDSGLAYVVAMVSAFAPAAVGLVVLAVPRLRRAGVGLVLGLAVGAIVYAGSCATLLTATGEW